MTYTDNISSIEELAASQDGVFTSKQAEAFGIPRYALSYAAKAGRTERVCHGAYRLASSMDSGYDELRGLWMLTMPAKPAHERMGRFDGVAVCGTTAAAVHDIGDFFLSPYRIAVPRRFNSRKGDVKFVVAAIPADDVTWRHGLPVTSLERTIADLAASGEDRSLVADALVDAIDAYGTTSFSLDRLMDRMGPRKAEELLADAGVLEGGPLELVRTDSVGHVALVRRDH